MGFFDKFKLSRLTEGLGKTRETLREKLAVVTKGRTEIDDEFLEELENILVSADVGVETTLAIVDAITERAGTESYRSEDELNGMLMDEIGKMLMESGEEHPVEFDAPLPAKPYVILIVGVNGAGKTTSVAKLASNYEKAGKKVMIAAADTFRAAAYEQLQVWAERAGVPLIGQGQGADPASVVFDAVSAAVARNADVVLVDTAGRLHNKSHLMEELAKIMRVAKKENPGSPARGASGARRHNWPERCAAGARVHEICPCNRHCGNQARRYGERGIVLSISRELKLPVKYIGVGEKIDDLQLFDRSRFVGALLGREKG